MSFFKSLYIEQRFFIIATIIVVLFGLSYFIPFLFNISQVLLLAIFVFLFADILLVFIGKNRLKAKREVPEKFSNGDNNDVKITIENHYPFSINFKIIDEIPEQFQKRDFEIKSSLKYNTGDHLNYTLRPTERGEYHFGNLNIYVSSPLKFVSKRYVFDADAMVPTYPSFKQLKKFELLNINRNSVEYGIKKIRRIGHTMEFEQIKEYVQGDDIRTINWKATAKKNNLMVNQFQDEKSQPVYSIIDKGRIMQMPFEGLSLLDYAINSTLVISNVVLKKQDKAGMLSFSRKVENIVAAERRSSQMRLILEGLYNVKTDFFESDFSRLYGEVKRHITHRSLILLYTNFETLDGLKRQLPYLKALAKSHLLIVIFFKNTELNQLVNNKAKTIQEVYDKVIAEKFAFEKRLIANELKKFGIYSILTTPENLTIDTLNKYLEVKARGLL